MLNGCDITFRKPESGGCTYIVKKKKERNNEVNASWQRPAEECSCQKKKLSLINLYMQCALVILFIWVSLQKMHEKSLINVIALKYFISNSLQI